jgi:crotonobetainyl-CoA:carnitine CoA-transferase CaiB-like acyl-CoA transferase
MFLMCNKEKFWPVLCERIGRPGWATDPRYSTFKARLANRETLTRDLDDALSARTTAEWMEALGGLVPASPVFDVGQALDNPFVREGGRMCRAWSARCVSMAGRRPPWPPRRLAPIPKPCSPAWA